MSNVLAAALGMLPVVGVITLLFSSELFSGRVSKKMMLEFESVRMTDLRQVFPNYCQDIS